MDASWRNTLTRWCADRGHDLDLARTRLHGSEWESLALAQHRAGASDKVVWQLLDGAMAHGRDAAGKE